MKKEKSEYVYRKEDILGVVAHKYICEYKGFKITIMGYTDDYYSIYVDNDYIDSDGEGHGIEMHDKDGYTQFKSLDYAKNLVEDFLRTLD